MKWNEFLRDYFTFTRKERIGLLIVILVIIGIWIFPKVSRPSRPKTLPPDTSWITAAKKIMTRTGDSPTGQRTDAGDVDNLAFDRPVKEQSSETKAPLFTFDPNALSFEGWKKLGVREKTIATIQNYLQKGGHFSKAEDLKRIYGIRPDEYARLEPYIRIAATPQAELLADAKAFKKETSPNRPR